MAELKKPFAHLEKLKAGNERYQQKQRMARHHSQQRGNEMNPGNPWSHTLEQARAQSDMGNPPSYDELIAQMLADARKDMGR
jgi:hypothetical protein